jgi:hypothetical protein
MGTGESASEVSVVVRVRNNGARTIVAWGIEAAVTFADETRRSGALWVDGYEDHVRKTSRSPVLPTNATTSVPIPISASGKTATAAIVQPTFVVFDDDTAAGNERSVALVFAARALNERVWAFVERILDDAVGSSLDARSAVEAAEVALKEADDDLKRSWVFDDVTLRLRNSLRESDNARLQSSLNEFRQEARLRRVTAAAHVTRR